MLRHEEFHQSPMEFKRVSWNMMAGAEKNGSEVTYVPGKDTPFLDIP